VGYSFRYSHIDVLSHVSKHTHTHRLHRTCSTINASWSRTRAPLTNASACPQTHCVSVTFTRSLGYRILFALKPRHSSSCKFSTFLIYPYLCKPVGSLIYPHVISSGRLVSQCCQRYMNKTTSHLPKYNTIYTNTIKFLSKSSAMRLHFFILTWPYCYVPTKTCRIITVIGYCLCVSLS
jgi:hypothetical protein